MDILQDFRSVVDDLSFLLEADREILVLHTREEESPLHMELIFSPPAETTVSKDTETRSGLPASEPRLAAEDVRRKQTRNSACSLCADRMYPVKRFQVEGRLPVLVLHYNGSISDAPTRPDRSERYILGNPEEDDLFVRMVAAAGYARDDFFYQEFPACHFNAARSLPEDWNERSRNCLALVSEAVVKNGIRLVIATGASAIFLAGEDMARKLSVSGELTPMQLEGEHSVQLLIIRSPAALLALEKRRKALKARPDVQEKYKTTVAEEKQVKQAILGSLKKVREFV